MNDISDAYVKADGFWNSAATWVAANPKKSLLIAIAVVATIIYVAV